MTTLHLMVGLPCSGKTTLARQLEREQRALRLTPDEWQIPLFGQDVHDPQHNARHDQIEALLWDLAKRALSIGTNVILDYGFWAQEEREFFREQARQLGASSEIHYIEVSKDELLRRLAVRNGEVSAQTFFIPQEMLESWFTIFQPPTEKELLTRT